MTKGNNGKRKKPLSSLTERNKELRKEERSSDEVDYFFAKHQGRYNKVSKRCESGKCGRVAVCTVFVRNEEDYAERLEDEEGLPYRACSLHAGKKTFDGNTVLREIEEIISDKEETSPSIVEESLHTNNPGLIVQPEVVVTPLGSPELQAMLDNNSKSNVQTQAHSTSSSTSPSWQICEIRDCYADANYEAAVENEQGHTIARVCSSHATDSIQGGKTTDLKLINADNLSAYSMSSVVLSDDSNNSTVKQLIQTALNTSPLGQGKPQGQKKSRRKSDPIQKKQPTFDLRNEKDFPSLESNKATSKNLQKIPSVTKATPGDKHVSENLIDKAAQPKTTGKAQGGDTESTPRSKRVRTKRRTTNSGEMSTDSSDESRPLYESKFKSIVIPTVNHPTPFPKKPTNANALKLFINEEPIGVALEWTPLHIIKAYPLAKNDKLSAWAIKRGKVTVPANWTFRELRTKGEIADSEHLQLVRSPPKASASVEPMDYDLPKKGLEDSIHAPQNENGDTEKEGPNPLKEIVKETTVKAFLGEGSTLYAEIAGQKTEKTQMISSSYLSKKTCAISPDLKSKRPVPNTDLPNVAFWDISAIQATQEQIWEAVVDSKPVGFSPRENAQWLELAFATIGERNIHLGKQIEIAEGQFIVPLPPRKWSPQQIYIRMANVPLLPEAQLRESIEDYWSTFGSVGRIEPHYYRNSKILSRRWDLILTIQGGKSLAAPVIFQLHGVRVMCYWEGSEAACTTCKSKGHWAQNCTPKDRKNAERRDKLDPAPPIKQTRTPEKEKGKQKEDKPTSENEEPEKMRDELNTILDTYIEELSSLPPAEIPPAKTLIKNSTKKVEEQLAKAYVNSGFAAKDTTFTVTESSNSNFKEVKSKRQLQKEKKKQAGSSTSPKSPPPVSRNTTPPPSNKRSATQARTPTRRQNTSKIPKVYDTKYMQSYKPTGKRSTWHPWLVANRIAKTMGWFTQENLNYFAAYPNVAQDWLDRIPKEVYDHITKALRMDKLRGIHIPAIPDQKSMLENHKIVATPHASLNKANLPPSLSRVIQVEYNSLMNPPYIPSIMPEIPITAEQWERLAQHKPDTTKYPVKITIKANTVEGDKVSAFFISGEELATDLRDRLSAMLGVDIVPHKDENPLSYATLVGKYNQIKEGDEISIKAYNKIFPPKENKALGPKFSIFVMDGKTNSFSEYMYPNEKLGDFKKRIAERIETSIEDFTISWRETIVDKDKSPKDYEIGSNARIHLRHTPQAPEQAAESSMSTQKGSNMEWEDVEDTVKLTLEGGEYQFPLDTTPKEILSKYAVFTKNELYASIYALYSDSYKLPMNSTLGELLTQNFIREGDILIIGPEQENLL